MRFTTEDVVRHPLVGAIVRAYEKAEKAEEFARQERKEAVRKVRNLKHLDDDSQTFGHRISQTLGQLTIEASY